MHAVVFPGVRRSGKTSFAFAWPPGVQLIPGQGPVYICCRPRRVFSLPAPIGARPRLLFGRLLGGPVYSRAGPVYVRVGHAGLSRGVPCVRVASCLFPCSLAHFSRVRNCFPESSFFRPGIACFSLGRPGSSLFQDRSGLYLSQATPVSLGVCSDLGQTRSAASGECSEVQFIPGRVQFSFA